MLCGVWSCIQQVGQEGKFWKWRRHPKQGASETKVMSVAKSSPAPPLHLLESRFIRTCAMDCGLVSIVDLPLVVVVISAV